MKSKIGKTYSFLFACLLATNLGYGQTMGRVVKIAGLTNGARWVQMAFSPDGVAHVVYEEHLPGTQGHNVMYVSYDGQTAGKPLTINPVAGDKDLRPHVASGPKGQLAVVWQQDNECYLRVYDSTQQKWLGVEEVNNGLGGFESYAAWDKDGDLFIFWFWDGAGVCYTRAKIGGVWEGVKRMSPAGIIAKQGAIGCGQDGWIWCIWREKMSDGNYKLRYSKRTKSTNWSPAASVNDAGPSSAHPHMAVGPDNVPYIIQGDSDESVSFNQPIYMITLDEKTNPRELVIPEFLQHYPRIAIDRDGRKHVAIAIGGGDYGDGVRYTNNIGGQWKGVQTFNAIWPKVPGIAHDGFGNVAVAWSSMASQGADTRIFIASLYPISRKVMQPPADTVANLVYEPGNPEKYTFNFAWKADSQNNDKDLEGYRLYKKKGQALEALLTVNKATTSASLTFNEFDPENQYLVTTVGTSGLESVQQPFTIAYPAIQPPAGLIATVRVSRVRANPAVTFNLSWQANPQNSPTLVKEYRIYKKENGGNFVLLATVPKTVTSTSISGASLQKKVKLGIVTVSVLSNESQIAVF